MPCASMPPTYSMVMMGGGLDLSSPTTTQLRNRPVDGCRRTWRSCLQGNQDWLSIGTRPQNGCRSTSSRPAGCRSSPMTASLQCASRILERMANKRRCASGSRSMVIASAGGQGQNLACTALTVFLTRGGTGKWPWSKANPTVTPSGFTGFLPLAYPAPQIGAKSAMLGTWMGLRRSTSSSSQIAVAMPFGSGCLVPQSGIERSWSACQQKIRRPCTWKARTSS